MFDGQTILITGGTGSWGTELSRYLLTKYTPREVRIFSRGEFAQVKMRRRFNNEPRLRFIIGDVRDYERVHNAAKNVDVIFHLAALKHVPVCEENPYEAVRTNITGTQNVIDAALAHGVKKVIDISSDKAASPLNLYGTTKSVGEKLIVSANALSSDTAFFCIRAGNVLGTTGSVVPLFRRQILGENSLTITDEGMTRFFMNLNEVIAQITEASMLAVGGEIFVINMSAFKIKELAAVMRRELGNKDTREILIGKRPGEKVHEVLITNDEQERCFVHGKFFVVLPSIRIEAIEKHYAAKKLEPVPFSEFTSANARLLNQQEIKVMLDNENWLTKNFLESDAAMSLDSSLTVFQREGWIKSGATAHEK